MKKQIEDTKGVLQDLVVVVSLVRTLTDSFGSVNDLYRKLKRKSKDIKEDIKEDIKDHIREDVKEEIREHHLKHPLHRRRDSFSDDERDRRRPSRWRSRSRSRRRRDESRDSDEEFIETSPSLVRAEYDRGYRHLGDKFAQGDLIAQNQLQSQIIALQQTLLYIYEDIIIGTGLPRHPPSYHLQQLVETTRATRTASIQALAMQYQRMLLPPETREPLALPGSYPLSPKGNGTHGVVVRALPSTRALSIGHDSDSSNARDRPVTPKLIAEGRKSWSSASSTVSNAETPKRKPPSSTLFCVYARDLQHSHALPLADNFKAGGDNRCPYCRAHIPTRPNKAWEIVKADEKRHGVDRAFLVSARFMVKCHREGGGYACTLCNQYRDADTVCSEPRALVEHLWNDHTCNELEWDGNIGEEH